MPAADNVKTMIVPALTRAIVLMTTIVIVVTVNVHPYQLVRAEMIEAAPGPVMFRKVERLVAVWIVRWMRIALVKHRARAV